MKMYRNRFSLEMGGTKGPNSRKTEESPVEDVLKETGSTHENKSHGNTHTDSLFALTRTPDRTTSVNDICRSAVGAELKREWKNARDCYRQALSIRKNRNNMKPWRYEKLMEFVKPYLKPKRHTEEIALYGDCFETIDDVIIKSEVTTDFEEELSASDCISENPPNEEPSASPQRTNKRKRHSSDHDIHPVISRVENIVEKSCQQKQMELQQSREASRPSRDLEPQNKIMAYTGREPNDLDLFFASICETAKALPRKYQNKIKKEVLEIVTKAEEDCETETILP